MKLLALLLFSSLFGAAQTTTTASVQPQSIVLSVSCLKLGEGRTLMLTGRLLTVSWLSVKWRSGVLR